MTAIQTPFFPHFTPKREVLGSVMVILALVLFPGAARLIGTLLTPAIAGMVCITASAILVLISFKAVAMWLINTIWPVIADYTRSEFNNDFGSLKPLHKVLIVAGFYVLLIYALIATLGALR